MAKLSDVLSKIEDNVKVQYLDGSMVSSKDKKRDKYTEVTFATEVNDTDGLYSGVGKTAVIVWVDRDEFNNAMIELNRK